MESVLYDLISALKTASGKLNEDAQHSALISELHSTQQLPDAKLSALSSEALDLLSEIRLLLEPGQLILADHFLGYMSTKALCTVVELGVPDILSRGPMGLSELSYACNARPDRLRQLMRTLRNNNIFSYDSQTDAYRNNHVSELLLSDHWTQWRNWVDLYGNEFYDMARGMPQACKAGAVRNPAQVHFDTDDSMFKYFVDQGWLPKFHKTLSGGAIAQAPGILEDYPWEEVQDGTVLDIGGGGGGLISLLLRKFKNMTGAILEAPKVIGQARSNFHDPDGEYADVGSQIPPSHLYEGDFFLEIPPSDVYTMKWCLHDWDDDKAAVILKNIRKAIVKSSKSRLIILESVLKDGHMGRLSRYADMNMMVAVGGRERDEAQWRNLANQTGWQLRKIYPLRNAWPCAIEFVPDWVSDEKPRTSEQAGLEVPDSVVAEMRFLEPWDVAKGNPYVRINPAPGYSRTNINWRDHRVTIHDARPKKLEFDLDTHGFQYFDDEVPKSLIEALRSDDREVVRSRYYAHVEDFVKRITGAPRVLIFDHTQRKRRPELSKTQNADGKEQPATMVHVDQSEKGALRRLAMNLDDTESTDEVLRGRVRMINVWRPLNGPVQDWPLATVDARSVKTSEMFPCDLLEEKDKERGQTATFTFSDEQKWFYLDKQETSEVTVIKIWDSSKQGNSTYCAHAAFNHPEAPLDIEPRESVEVRCLVIDAPDSV